MKSSAAVRAGNNLIFLGAPGVGKGTFASRIAKKLGVPAISTGDIIRAEIKQGTEFGNTLKAYTNAGKLVPDELVNKIVKKRLGQKDAAAGYILDGYPRTIGQAEDLGSFSTVTKVVNFTLPEHVLMAKLLARRVCADCGRGYNVANIREGELDMPPLLPKPSDCDICHGKPRLITRDDDKEEIVKERLQVYRRQTSPLIEYYQQKGVLAEFPVKKGLDDMPRLTTELHIKDGA